MKLVALLIAIRDILFLVRDFMIRVSKAVFLRKTKEATEKVENEGDQRGVEEVLSGKSGEPTDHDYDGLRTRPEKDRR